MFMAFFHHGSWDLESFLYMTMMSAWETISLSFQLTEFEYVFLFSGDVLLANSKELMQVMDRGG